jgi:hypothetical protein
MGLLKQYLQIKNRVKFNDAIMDGIARAISNGVEQHISQKLLINQNNNFNNRLEANKVIDADVHQNGIPYQDAPEEPEISESKPVKKSFRELKENVKVFSNGDSKGVYDLNLGNVSAEPTNEQKPSVFVFSKSISLILPSESRIGSFDHALHLGRKCLSCTSPFAY